MCSRVKGLVKTLQTNNNPSVLEKSKTVKELLDIKLDDQKITEKKLCPYWLRSYQQNSKAIRKEH